MPDRATIERIAKFIARAAMNDNQPESEAAIKGAFTRMQRDGVSFEDVLGLPDDLIYQKGLMDLAAYIVAQQEHLSQSAKRDLYARYVLKVANRFSGAQQEASQRDDDSGAADDKTYGRKNDNTSKSTYGNTGKDFSFGTVISANGLPSALKSILSVTATSFRRGGLVWHVLCSPGAAIRLAAVSSLFGMGLGLLALTVAASLHSWLGMSGPWIDMRITTAWGLIGAPLAFFKAVTLYRAGWF